MVNNAEKVSYQVMWNRLISIVEEQAQALIRTAFSTSVREAGDLSAGVYDQSGRMLAQAVTGTPGHVNAMAAAVPHFIRRIGPDNIVPGDVYITNNPWEGTGHLHDITVVTPTFLGDSLIGFFACTAHVVDIGGRGFNADAASVFEEGLHIPAMKLFTAGEVNETLLQIVRSNVREPDQVVGDIYALATCNDIGQRRLLETLQEFGLTEISAVSEYILFESERATRECIAALRNGTAAGRLTVDGYSVPIEIKVRVSIEDDQLICDFTGSSGVDGNGINVPLVYTQAYSCYALKCAIAPMIPNNTASLEPFVVKAPEGSILNAPPPAPVALRHVIGQMLPDAIYSALHQLLPGTVPAEGSSALCNFQVSLRPIQANEKQTETAEVLTFNSGGTGARSSSDGLNATAFPSGVMTMPVEATEQIGPIVIWQKELRSDSGGAGKHRGGLGQWMEIGARDGYEFDFSAMFDRAENPAKGRDGGNEGAATLLTRSNGEPLRAKGKQFVAEGERITLGFAGGGGYGEPSQRERSAVKRDLVRGYLSLETARKEYNLSDEELEQVNKAIITGQEISE
ncbi:MAG: hydantoinase B/oxoprolinase family protein [Pseudomonadota bacterium]